MNPNKVNILGSVALGMLLLTSTGAYAYDADTLAFYPFCDYANGADVTKIAKESGSPMTFTNAVDSAKYLATATTVSYWSSSVLSGSYLFMTNDVPGRYLMARRGFVSEGPLVESYQTANLHARSDSKAGNGVKLTLAGLASELSKYDDWTVECFVKVPTTADFASWPRVMKFDAGLTFGGNPAPIELIATASSYSDNLWQINLGTSKAIEGRGAAYNAGWMHIALVCTATELKYYVNYTQVGATATIAHAGVNADEDLLFNPQPNWSGFVTGLRVKKAALTADQMIHTSDCPTGESATLAQWPLEGAIGTQPTGEKMTVVDVPAGNVPLLEERRNGRVYEQGVQVRETLAAVRLSGVEKASGATYATGNALMIPENSFAPILGDFTMEGFFKFDRKVWETKYYTDKNETRPYAGLFRQDWIDNDKTRRVWQISLQRLGDGTYHPRVGATKSNWSAMTETSFGNAVKTDGKWHHYAVTYDHAQMTFEFFEDCVSLGTYTYSDPIGLDKQPSGGNTAYYVGAAAGAHPFEGLVDEVRLSQKKLAPAEFISIDDRQGMMLIVR